MTKIILHIGTEKTGSTSIQRALAHDRPTLAQRGILFPVLFGSENHMEIPVFSMDDDIVDELRQSELNKAQCDLPEYRARLTQQLRREIKDTDAHTIVLSNEHCHSRLNSPAALQQLRDLLGEFADEIEVVVYLRRQDRLAISLHSTRVKLGGIGEALPAFGPNGPGAYFNFRHLLDRYSDMFGADAMRVRLFEPAFLTDGDVVADFYNVAQLGVPAPALPKANEALSLKQNLFLERFNETFPLIVDGKLNPQRGPIFHAISKTLKGRPHRPSRGEAEAFYDAFRAGNAKVKARFFPDLDRDTLFDEDFSGYPENADADELSVNDMFEFVSAIWTVRAPKRN